jgi:hypothetical protein
LRKPAQRNKTAVPQPKPSQIAKLFQADEVLRRETEVEDHLCRLEICQAEQSGIALHIRCGEAGEFLRRLGYVSLP